MKTNSNSECQTPHSWRNGAVRNIKVATPCDPPPAIARCTLPIGHWLWPLSALLLGLAAAPAQTYTVLHSFGGLTEPTGCQSKAPLVQGPDGTLYGTTTASGYYGGNGTVFKIQPDSTGFALLKDFTNSADGANPWGGLVLSGATLYGTTYQGGASSYGTVFKINTDGSGFAVIKNFGLTNGAYPEAGLVLSGSTLFGTTHGGGTGISGTVFSVSTNGTDFAVLYNFGGIYGSGPAADLALVGDTLYGTTTQGGVSGPTIFQINTNGNGFGVVCYCESYVPAGGVIVCGTTLFGATKNGGDYGNGTVWKFGPIGAGHWVVLKSFDGTNGAVPAGSVLLSGSTLFGTTRSGGVTNQGTVFCVDTNGGNFTVLKNFTGTDGSQPSAALSLSGATLYGTTYAGGTSSGGTVFKLDTNGQAFATLKQFQLNCTDGYYPVSSLVLSGNTLYGITDGGGASDYGVLFKINTDGSGYTVLKNFGSDVEPEGGLALSGNTLYGNGWDTLFSVGTDGSGYTELLNSADLSGMPQKDGFVLAGSTLFGTSDSTVFRLATNGAGFTVLTNWGIHAGFIVSGATIYGVNYDSYAYPQLFTMNTDGTDFTVIATSGVVGYPTGYLVLSGTTLYGTTSGGAVFRMDIDGSNFTNLAQLTASEGIEPQGLVLSGGTLYGTTFEGGTYGAGTIFQVNTDGTGFQVLKQFTGYSPGDGQRPCSKLVVSGTTLFGTAVYGGAYGQSGVLFSLSLAPVLQMVNPACNGTAFTFSFQTQSNLAYAVEYNDDLSTTNWKCCWTTTGDGSLMPCCLPMTNATQRFFRVRQP